MKLTLRQVRLLIQTLCIYIPTASAYIDEEDTQELQDILSSLERHLQDNRNDTN